MSKSEARERVLAAAEALFIERGFEAVTVKDIAARADIHHATIYHHIRQGGKAALYVEVLTRHLEMHRAGIRKALAAHPGDLRGQLVALAVWLLSQPPMDLVRMANSDLPSIDRVEAAELANLAYEVMFIPVEGALAEAQARGEITHPNMGNIAGAIFSSVEGLQAIPDMYIETSRLAMAEELIDVFLRGIAAT